MEFGTRDGYHLGDLTAADSKQAFLNWVYKQQDIHDTVYPAYLELEDGNV